MSCLTTGQIAASNLQLAVLIAHGEQASKRLRCDVDDYNLNSAIARLTFEHKTYSEQSDFHGLLLLPDLQ